MMIVPLALYILDLLFRLSLFIGSRHEICSVSMIGDRYVRFVFSLFTKNHS